MPQNQSVTAGIGQGWGVFRTYDSVTYGRISASSAEWVQCVTKCILSEHHDTMEGFRSSSDLCTPKGGRVHLGISRVSHPSALNLLSQESQFGVKRGEANRSMCFSPFQMSAGYPIKGWCPQAPSVISLMCGQYPLVSWYQSYPNFRTAHDPRGSLSIDGQRQWNNRCGGLGLSSRPGD